MTARVEGLIKLSGSYIGSRVIVTDGFPADGDGIRRWIHDPHPDPRQRFRMPELLWSRVRREEPVYA